MAQIWSLELEDGMHGNSKALRLDDQMQESR